MDNKIYLEMKNLSVGYHGNTLIHDICINIKKGEIVTLIGPNGSGKSTILKSITRQLKILKGQVIFDSDDLYGLSEKKLATKMAVVLTDRLKPELMTCYDIVATGRYPYTGRLGILTREDEEIVDHAIQAVHAGDIAGLLFGNVSDGQKQRILLARAIAQEPDVIVLDEPTSFLDVKYKLELLAILRDMAKKKQITVIMSLHEIDLAMKVTDKMICVKGDTIFRFGTPEEIFTEDLIRELYELDNGFFDPCFGSIELPRPRGEAIVFVLAGGGSAISTYRSLQKQGIAFTTGILWENDIDYRLARLLAHEIVTESAFNPISDLAFEKAVSLIKKSDKVIDTNPPLGTCNARIQELRKLISFLGK